MWAEQLAGQRSRQLGRPLADALLAQRGADGVGHLAGRAVQGGEGHEDLGYGSPPLQIDGSMVSDD